MARRILFVRAVNVGGTVLPMAAFRALLEELGGTAVRTYIASGNAVLDVPGDPAAFDRSVETALHARFGIDREVFSRTPDEVRAALAAHPFDVADPRRSYLVLLDRTPEAERVRDAAAVPSGDDRWAVVGRELHVRFAGGMGRAELDLDRLLRSLGAIGTARNLRTAEAVIALADA